MKKLKLKFIILYLFGIVLLVFGNRRLWEIYLLEKERDAANEKMATEAAAESYRKFEVQELVFDSVWKNNTISFQTIIVGRINFSDLPQNANTIKETNDDENASDSL